MFFWAVEMGLCRRPIVKNSSLKCPGEKWRGKIGEFRQTILSNADGFLFRHASWCYEWRNCGTDNVAVGSDTTPV